MGRKLVLIFICFIILLPVMIVTVDLFSISVRISGGDIIRTIGNVLSDGFQSVRSVLVGDVGNFSISDAIDRASGWIVGILMTILITIFLKGKEKERREDD